MASRTSSDGSIGGSLGGSIGGSLGDQASTTSTGSNRRPRRSLDELLALQRARETDFADMPSLSSFRADEMSVYTSTSYTSVASNSRGGDSRGGDCDISLPSLSSFRMEDLSTCSSYHSVQTNTYHLSDQSAEGWASFTSGNVSAETDSDDGRKRAPLTVNGEIRGAPLKPSRSSSASSLNSSPTQRVPGLPLGKGVLKRANSMNSNAAPATRTSPPEEVEHENRTLPMKRPTRTVSPTPDDRRTINGLLEASPDSTSNARPPERTFSDTGDPERKPVERTESLELNAIQQVAQKERSLSVLMDSLRNSAADGSSSSLRGGDSLPRLPRRTSTVEDQGFLDDDTGRYSDDPSNYSDDEITKISDDEITRSSGDDVSLNSDVESDLSVDTETGHNSLSVDTSDRITMGSRHEVVSSDNSTNKTEGDDSVEASGSNLAEKEGVGKEANTAEAGAPDEHTEETEIPIEPASDLLERTVPLQESTTTPDAKEVKLEIDNTADETAEESTHSEEKTPSTRSVPGNGPKKNNSDESGGTSAEESGASNIDNELDGAGDSRNRKSDGENKRGTLLRKVSSTFRNLGKTASFRNSFRMIGKQASKLKKGARKQAEDQKIRHEKLVDDPGVQDE